MNFVYLMMLLIGVYTLYLSLSKQVRFSNQREQLSPKRNRTKGDTKAINAIDYRSVIIKNSRWLSILDELDKNLQIKLKVFIAAACIAVLLNVINVITFSSSGLGMLLLLLMMAIIVLPGLLLKPAIKRKTKDMMDVLPYLVDLIAVCIQSGMTVESSLKFVSGRFQHLNDNLAELIEILIKRAEVSGMEEALSDLYRSMEITEMRMFTATLQQSVHYGTSLYEHLIELAHDMRELQLLVTEEKIGGLSAKMSVPLIIFIMFPITILIIAPGILRIVKNGIF